MAYPHLSANFEAALESEKMQASSSSMHTDDMMAADNGQATAETSGTLSDE
jgi:hypothetical protein